MRLLIADRDSTERTGIEWLIRSFSMRFSDIRQAGDIASLMTELEEYQPDILLLELEMVPPASWEALMRAAQKYAGACIAITAEAVFERAWQALQLQAAGFLIKPLSPDQIRQTLSTFVRTKTAVTGVGGEKESLPSLYSSLFFEGNPSDEFGMLVIQPEDKKDIKELAEWLENYSIVHRPHILMLRDHLVCLLPTLTEEVLYQEAQRIVRESLGRNGNKLFIAVSSSGSLHTCYEKALQTMKTVFFKGYQQVVKIQDAPVFLDIDPFLTPAEQRAWIRMLEEGDRAAIKRWLYEQFTEFPEGFPEPELLRIRLTSILAHLRRFMQTYQLDQIPRMELRYQEIFQTILHVPVLFRIVQEVLLFIFDIVQAANHQKENAHGDFIERGLRYIDEYFHRSDLSLEEVAGYVQRSPSYFSHILSVKRSQTFSQYVTDVRMKHAKHLLSTTPLTIREIAFATGYEDPNYFSRLFKELTGCSPRVWRAGKNQV